MTNPPPKPISDPSVPAKAPIPSPLGKAIESWESVELPGLEPINLFKTKQRPWALAKDACRDRQPPITMMVSMNQCVTDRPIAHSRLSWTGREDRQIPFSLLSEESLYSYSLYNTPRSICEESTARRRNLELSP